MNWTLFILAGILGLAGGLWIVMRRESKKSVITLNEKEFVENIRKGQLVDVRAKVEFDEGHINGARNIPLAILTRQPGKLRKDLPIYLYGAKEKQSKRAALILYGKGYEQIFQLQGGLSNYTTPLKTSKK
ncbi:MAG: rhodanese-like domain-containing protein [Turicibacter sp.]